MSKISKTKIDAMIKANKPENHIITINAGGDKAVDITVTSTISRDDFLKAVVELVEMNFPIDKNTGKNIYAPYMNDFASWYVALKYFTDIDLDIVGDNGEIDNTNADRIWNLRYCGTLKDDIYQIIKDVWFDIEQCAYEMIEERKNNLKPSFRKLWESLDEYFDRAKEQFKNFSEADLKKFIEDLGNLKELDSTDKLLEFTKHVARKE